MKKIAYTRPDGGVSIVSPAPKAQLLSESEDEFVARIAAKDVPADATNIQIVDESEIPADRTFRNALVAAASRIEHDMGKCRALHKDRLRRMRAPMLVALDVEYMKALERGDTAAMQAIAEKKRALRDVTLDPAFDAAATPEELKTVIPAALQEPT